MLRAKTEFEVKEMFHIWKEAMECKGLRVNLDNTKLMVNGEEGERKERSKWPCVTCGKGVRSHCIQFVSCKR